MPQRVGFWRPLDLKERARCDLEMVTVQDLSPPSSTCPPLPAPTLSLSPCIHSVWFYPLISPFTPSFGCIFLSKLAETVSFGIAGINQYCLTTTTGFSEDTTLLGLTLYLCLCVHPLSPQGTLSQAWEVGTSQSNCTISHVRRDSAKEKAAKQAQPLLDTRDISLALHINQHQEINTNKPQARRGI